MYSWYVYIYPEYDWVSLCHSCTVFWLPLSQLECIFAITKKQESNSRDNGKYVDFYKTEEQNLFIIPFENLRNFLRAFLSTATDLSFLFLPLCQLHSSPPSGSSLWLLNLQYREQFSSFRLQFPSSCDKLYFPRVSNTICPISQTPSLKILLCFRVSFLIHIFHLVNSSQAIPSTLWAILAC